MSEVAGSLPHSTVRGESGCRWAAGRLLVWAVDNKAGAMSWRQARKPGIIGKGRNEKTRPAWGLAGVSPVHSHARRLEDQPHGEVGRMLSESIGYQ
jgi:hypothetical protein